MTESKLFAGGVPTEPDVEKLMEAVTEFEEGAVFLHTEIGSIIGQSPKSSRYRTITNRWRRKLLREKNIDLDAVVGVGFKVLSDAERVSRGIENCQQGTRKIRRGGDRLGRADRAKLDEAQQKQQDHMLRFVAAQLTEAKNTYRQIASAGSIVSLPKVAG